jgi:hypothetical protein
MVVKAIFSECSFFLWLDTAEHLLREYGWKPVYWTALPDFEKHIKQKFPDVIYHSTLDAIRGISPHSCASMNLPALDQPLLEKLAFCESIVLTMMNRMDINGTFSYNERKNLYYSYVKYWSGVLDTIKPDVYISPVSPHVIYDYVLYCLCKMRGIKTIMFNQPSLYGWIYPVEHFEEMPKSIQNLYENLLRLKRTGDLDPFTLSNQAEYYLKKTSSDYSTAVPFYMKEQFKQNQIGIFLLKKFITHPDDVSNIIRKGKVLFLKDHYVKQKGKKIQESNMKGLEYLWNRVQGIKKKNQLKKHYKTLQQEPDFTHPYVYIALHYQPENSTSPQGEIFADQYLMVDLLSKCIPDDWSIYVKEHSSQWHVKLHGERGRTIDFYDSLATLPNVRIIPVASPNFELIDKAKVVATVTGTAGWEAIVRGKPVLIFGHAWYEGCEGVFYTASIKTCRDALTKITAGYQVDREAVRLYVHVIEKVGMRGYVDPGYEPVANVSYDDNVATLTRTIQHFFTEISSSKNEPKNINSKERNC